MKKKTKRTVIVTGAGGIPINYAILLNASQIVRELPPHKDENWKGSGKRRKQQPPSKIGSPKR